MKKIFIPVTKSINISVKNKFSNMITIYINFCSFENYNNFYNETGLNLNDVKK